MRSLALSLFALLLVSPLLRADDGGAERARVLLKELETFLTPQNMGKLVPDKKVSEVYRLSENEDMEPTSAYIIGDDMLMLLRKRGILNTEFGVLIENLQNVADGLAEQERKQVLASWRSLWLEKLSNYVRFHHAQKRNWTFDHSHTVDYDSNVALDPEDPSRSRHANKDAAGFSYNAAFGLRPFINVPSLKSFDIETRVSGSQRLQSRIKETQSDTMGLGQVFAYNHHKGFLRKTALSYDFTRSWSQNPANSRMEFDQHAVNLSFLSIPVRLKHGPFESTSWRLSFGYRAKTDFRDASVKTSKEDDSDSITATLGQNFDWMWRKDRSQSVGWQLRYEQQQTSPSTNRNYNFTDVGLNHNISFGPLGLAKRGLSLRSSFEVRAKDWDNPNTKTTADEGQITLQSALRAAWTANWSSRLSLSYMTKDQDFQGGGSTKINQFRAALTNTFLTF